MTSSWCRFTQPAKATIATRSPTASIMDRVYLRRLLPHLSAHAAAFSDSTGCSEARIGAVSPWKYQLPPHRISSLEVDKDLDASWARSEA